MRNSWRWLAAAALVLAAFGIVSVAEPDSWPAFGAGVAFAAVIGAVIVFLRRTPAAMAYVLTHRPLLRRIAVAVGVLPLLAMIGFLIVAPDDFDRFEAATVAVSVGGIMVASLLWTLPATARSVQEIAQDLPALTAKPKLRQAPLSLHDVIGAWRSLLLGIGVFAQVAVPWIALILATLLWAIWEANHIQRGQSGMATVLMLVMVTALMIGLFIAPATVMVSWCRWMLRSERPSGFIAVPGRAAFSLAWRLWLSLTVLGTVDGYLTKFLQRTVGGPLGETISGIGFWLLLAFLLALASGMALRLPAIAVGDNDFSRTRAAMTGRRLWPALPLGLGLSLAPFLAVAWALGPLADALIPSAPERGHGEIDPRLGLLVGLLFAVLLAAAASAAAFLAKGYEAAKAELA